MAPTPDTIEPNVSIKDTEEAKNQYNNKAFVEDEVQSNATNNAVQAATVATDSNTLDFDDILPHIGEFGTYQKILFFLMIPFAFFVAFVYFSQIFMTLVPEKHWCRIYELEHLPIEQRWVWLPYI